MIGIPKNLNSAQDIRNIVEQAKLGQLNKAEVINALEAIQNRAYLHIPVTTLTNAGKTATVLYSPEVAVGQQINGKAVTAVTHYYSDDNEPTATAIDFATKLAADTHVLKAPRPGDPFAALGITSAEIDSLKGELQ